MKKFFLLLFLLCAAQASAATHYVDGNLGGNCTGDYSIAARNCTGSDGNGYTAANAKTAIAATMAGDRLFFRSGIYPFALNTNSDIVRSGTSYADAPVIAGYTGETVTIRPSSCTEVFNLVVGGVTASLAYVIFQDLILDAVNCTYPATVISMGFAGANHIRLVNIEVKNAGVGDSTPGTGVQMGRDGSFFEWIGGASHDNGQFSFTPPDASYGAYVEADNVLIQGVHFYNNGGFGIHNYEGSGNAPNNNRYIGNRIWNNCAFITTNGCAGILLATGTGLEAYNNVVYDNAQRGISCLNSNCKVYGNTIVGNGHWGLSSQNSTADFSNNITDDNALGDWQDDSGNTLSGSNNRCDVAWDQCSNTTAPAFVNVGTKDFRLALGSGLIDAGLPLAAPYNVDHANVTRPQGPDWDIGAFEFTVVPVPSRRRITIQY